ncbi:hypothetical protein Leryth_008074, partial [Lithospermum erythrorhizon]
SNLIIPSFLTHLPLKLKILFNNNLFFIFELYIHFFASWGLLNRINNGSLGGNGGTCRNLHLFRFSD